MLVRIILDAVVIGHLVLVQIEKFQLVSLGGELSIDINVGEAVKNYLLL